MKIFIRSDDANCPWYDFIIPDGASPNDDPVRSYSNGTFLDASITLSDITGENSGFGDSNVEILLDFINNGIGWSSKVVKAISVAPATQPGWHSDPKFIPNTKTLEIFNDSRVSIRYHRAGGGAYSSNKYQWEVLQENRKMTFLGMPLK